MIITYSYFFQKMCVDHHRSSDLTSRRPMAATMASPRSEALDLVLPLWSARRHRLDLKNGHEWCFRIFFYRKRIGETGEILRSNLRFIKFILPGMIILFVLDKCDNGILVLLHGQCHLQITGNQGPTCHNLIGQICPTVWGNEWTQDCQTGLVMACPLKF